MSRVYDIGDKATLRGVFTDPTSGVRVDPATVTCTVRKPDGTIVTPAVSGSGGAYVAQVPVDQEGEWLYAFDGIGDYQAAEERSFTVRCQQVIR